MTQSSTGWKEKAILLKLNICVSSATGGVPAISEDRHLHSEASFLNYVLDELMPWQKEDGLLDFSLLEVNR